MTAKAIYEKGNFWFLGFLCLIAALGGFLFGFDTAVISGAVSFVKKQFMMSAFMMVPSLFIAWKVLPETKGKSLEEIEAFWQHRAKKEVQCLTLHGNLHQMRYSGLKGII
jgi:hypothetical protein